MADIYADEGITGTKVAVRQGFQRMIRDCMDGQIDIILTKSASRFSRNTVNTIQYVRMLKEKGIAVIFEKERYQYNDRAGRNVHYSYEYTSSK